MKGTQSTKYFILFFWVSDAFIFHDVIYYASGVYDIFISHIMHWYKAVRLLKKKAKKRILFLLYVLVRNSIKGDKDDNHLKFSFLLRSFNNFLRFRDISSRSAQENERISSALITINLGSFVQTLTSDINSVNLKYRAYIYTSM